MLRMQKLKNFISDFRNKITDKNPPSISQEKLFDDAIKSNIVPFHHSVFWGDRLLTIDKSAGFLKDKKFSKSFNEIHGSHVYDQYSSPNTIAWRLHTLIWAATSCLSLEGDFVECGTFKGDMAWMINENVDLQGRNKKLYLYDTFDGFSEKYSSNDDFPLNQNFVTYANKFYKDPTLYQYVKSRFDNHEHVVVTKGVVPDILFEKSPDKIAFMHIDLNSPAAEIGALELLFSRLAIGGIIVFDDYGWKQFYKQKEAEDLFMKNHKHTIFELPTGQGMVIKRY